MERGTGEKFQVFEFMATIHGREWCEIQFQYFLLIFRASGYFEIFNLSSYNIVCWKNFGKNFTYLQN